MKIQLTLDIYILVSIKELKGTKRRLEGEKQRKVNNFKTNTNSRTVCNNCTKLWALREQHIVWCK